MARPKKARRNDVERRIHFYRADCGTDKAGKPVAFSPKAALAHIDTLKFESFIDNGGRYYEVDDNIYCCWVVSPTRVQFAVIRRDALPQIEEKGIVDALDISETAGLVEQIHVRFFPSNIVGFDFNFYGPRLGRLATYLHVVGDAKSPQVVFEPLLRRDVSDELADGKELRLFALRIRKSAITTISQTDKSLGEAFRTIEGLSDADELEVVMRPKAYSGDSIGRRLMASARRLAQREDLREIATEFRVKVGAPGEAADSLDLLGDHFIFDRRILRQTAKGRGLNSDDAFAKIEDAYKRRRDDLKRAASLVGG